MKTIYQMRVVFDHSGVEDAKEPSAIAKSIEELKRLAHEAAQRVGAGKSVTIAWHPTSDDVFVNGSLHVLNGFIRGYDSPYFVIYRTEVAA